MTDKIRAAKRLTQTARALLLAALFVLTGSAAMAEYASPIEDYYPLLNGSQWTYTGSDPGEDSVSGTRVIRGVTTRIFQHATGSQLFFTTSDYDSAFKLYGMAGVEDGMPYEFIFNNPLNLLPILPTVGTTYTTSTSFTYLGVSFVIRSSFTANGFEDVQASSGALFKRALKTTHTLTIEAGGVSQSSTEIEWRARYYGAIKSIIDGGPPRILESADVFGGPQQRLLSEPDEDGFIRYQFVVGSVNRKWRVDGSYDWSHLNNGINGTFYKDIESFDVNDVLVGKKLYYSVTTLPAGWWPGSEDKLQWEERYENGFTTSRSEYVYYESGSLQSKKSYANGVIVSELGYYQSGNKKSLKSYVNGLPVNVTNYFESGKIQSEEFYKNGQLTQINTYYENGVLASQAIYKKGLLRSLVSYYESGAMKSQESYKGGVLKSSSTYYENGQLKSRTKKGKVIEYYQSGNEKKVTNVDGSYTTFDSYWNNTDKVHFKSTYDSTGKLISTTEYNLAGVLINTTLAKTSLIALSAELDSYFDMHAQKSASSSYQTYPLIKAESDSLAFQKN